MLDLLLTDVQKQQISLISVMHSLSVLTLTNVAGFAATVESEKNMPRLLPD